MILTKFNHQLLTQNVLDCLMVNNIKTSSAFVAHQPAILHAKCKLLTLEEIFTLRNYFIQNFDLCEVNVDPSNVKKLKNDIIQPLKSGYVYEIFGSPGCGKTQISMYLTAELAKQDRKVLYIDTKNDFSITRLKSYFGKNSSEDTLSKIKNIKLAKAFDLHQALQISNDLALTKEQSYEIDLIILDNITSLVLPLLEDDAMSKIFSQVGNLVKNLKKIALKQNCAILITNNASNMATKPALGKIFDKAADKRLFIHNNQRIQDQIADENTDRYSKIVIEISDFSISKE